MFYCIDFDTRRVESKCESRIPLDEYISENDLSLAVAVVGNEDELCLEFSLNEMTEVYGHLCGNPPKFEDEEEAASKTWIALQENEDIFPEFTSKLAKKLLKGSKIKQESNEVAKPTAKKTSPKKTTGSSRASLNLEDPIFVVDGKCKSGSILATIVTAIDDDLCATVGEVRDYILQNHVIPKTGELADEKFADHNLKYFLKQGKISTEEEL